MSMRGVTLGEQRAVSLRSPNRFCKESPISEWKWGSLLGLLRKRWLDCFSTGGGCRQLSKWGECSRKSLQVRQKLLFFCAVRLTLVANIAELVTDVYLLGFNNLALVLCPVALLFSHYKTLCRKTKGCLSWTESFYKLERFSTLNRNKKNKPKDNIQNCLV